LRRLHAAASARADDLTAAMVKEYGGVVQFAGVIVQSGITAFQAAEQALQEMPLTRSWGKTTVTLEPVGVAGLITAWNANTLFICLKLASAVAAGCTVVIKPSELSALQTQVLIEALQPPIRRGRSPRYSAQTGRFSRLWHSEEPIIGSDTGSIGVASATTIVSECRYKLRGA
jgi:Aldehyde dehydrogenase family